jgi:hypothetical protein
MFFASPSMVRLSHAWSALLPGPWMTMLRTMIFEALFVMWMGAFRSVPGLRPIIVLFDAVMFRRLPLVPIQPSPRVPTI